jgi:hypothetical protein
MPVTRPDVLTWIAATLLFVQCIYGLVACWLANNWGPALFCFVTIACGAGLAFQRWWSRPVTAAVALLLLVPWLWAVWHAAAAGVFHNRRGIEMILMILPGLLYAGLAVFCVYVAVRYIPDRNRRAQP